MLMQLSLLLQNIKQLSHNLKIQFVDLHKTNRLLLSTVSVFRKYLPEKHLQAFFWQGFQNRPYIHRS